MSARKAILDVGKEITFRKLRETLLSDAGYHVTSVSSAGGVERLSKKHFHAVVVGAYVPKNERNRIVKLVKQANPEANVVFYYDEKIEGAECADAILNCRGDHRDLVRTLRHLFAKKRNGGGGGGFKRALGGLATLVFSLGPLAESLLAYEG